MDSITILSPSLDHEDDEPANVYLWGYQPHFAVSLKVGAKQLFERLDERLFRDVFIVAINTQKESEHPVAVVEPPDHPMKPADFAKVLSIAQNSEASSPGTSYGYPAGSKAGEAWAEMSRRRDFHERIGSAVREVVAGAYSYEGVTGLVSAGRDLGPYVIFSVLLLNEPIRDEHPHLHRRTRGQFSIQVSLIDSVAIQFLRRCWELLPLSLSGSAVVNFPQSDETLRAAAESLMYTPFAVCGQLEGLHGGFQVCNEISTLTYEKAVGRSRLLLAARGHMNLSPSITFIDPVRLRNFRAVRKVLELAEAGEGLICDSKFVLGLGSISGNYNPTDEDLFVIEFVGHAKWQLSHAGHPLMEVEHGIPRLPQKKRQVQKLVETFERLFPDADGAARRKLGHLAAAASELTHGAIMILSADAAEEATRFGNQATRIEPAPLTPDLLRQASRIDGAALMTPNGICHAIGVILDGPVNRKGTSERGARFNSTIRYVLSRDCPCMGIVVSDDGSVDVVPAYRPRISGGEINRQIDSLVTMAKDESTNARGLNAAYDWLSERRFYLSAEQCDTINQAIAGAEANAAKPLKRVYHALVPDDDMDPSYLRP